jgi:hypothetical protein
VQVAAPLVIPAGGTISSAVDCAAVRILRLVTPSNWLGKGVAVTFQLSEDGGATWGDLHHAELGTATFDAFEVVARLAADAAITMPPDAGHGLQWLRIRSGTRTTPVPVPAPMTFGIVQKAAAG